MYTCCEGKKNPKTFLPGVKSESASNQNNTRSTYLTSRAAVLHTKKKKKKFLPKQEHNPETLSMPGGPAEVNSQGQGHS